MSGHVRRPALRAAVLLAAPVLALTACGPGGGGSALSTSGSGSTPASSSGDAGTSPAGGTSGAGGASSSASSTDPAAGSSTGPAPSLYPSPSPSGAGATRSPSPSGAPAKLLTGAAAKTFVVAVVVGADRHSPFHAVMVLKPKHGAGGKTLTQTVDQQEPGRQHAVIGQGTDVIDTITIGKKSWSKVDGKWLPDPDTDPKATEMLPGAKDVLSATEKPSKVAGLRVFSVLVRSTGSRGVRLTVVVDRLGRPLSMIGGDSNMTLTLRFTWDIRIVVDPPITV